MKKTRLDEFQTADWDRQLQLLEDVETAAEAERWLGPEAFAELRQLADGAHLGTGARNLIVVPGVMGSALESSGLGGIWWLDLLRTRDKLNELALSPGGHADKEPGYEISPCAIDVSYAPFRQALAQSGLFGGTVQFPYDWRKPLAASAGRLRDLVNKIYSDYGQPVHLVGHSMGGLMIRTALMLHGGDMWPKVGKVIFIATPHYGSPSIGGYLKNHLWGWEDLAVLGVFLSREAFRSMWGVLSLLPAPAGVYPGTRNREDHPAANFDMYDAAAWKLDLDRAQAMDLQNALDATRKHHQDLYQWHTTGLSPEEYRRMLQISGVGYKSLFRLEAKTGWRGLWRDMSRITKRDALDANREGDGRVPLASARLEKIEWRFIKGVHGAIHNIPAVARDVLAWLADEPLSLPDTAEGALSSHLSGDSVSAAPHLDGSADSSPYDDEYDRYADLTPEQIESAVADFHAGRLPRINQVRIL